MRTVIVGAGSAGAVIAARLSEDARHDVVLVEAGPDYPGALPDDLTIGTWNSMEAHDWKYAYTATAHRFWSAVPMAYPRGRVVGGSSAVNTCIALRGQPFDYDEWAERGLPEWSFEACLPFFKKLEADQDMDGEWHGKDGPIAIRRHPPEELVPWQAAFVEACRELGFPACGDTNDPTTTGAGPHAMNKIAGKRISAAVGYLTPAVRARPNLRIVANAHARRLRFSNGRAARLEIERFGAVKDLHADRFVLSAGALATPGILLRSGIGPAAEVARIGVDLVHEVPGVGARLLDHPGVAVFFVPRRPGFARVTDPLIQTVCRYTSTGSACANDMQLQPGSFVPLKGLPLPGVVLSACLGKPRAEGRLVFSSAHATAAPKIATRLLADADDKKRMHEALRHIAALSRTRVLEPLARPVYPSRRPFDAEGNLLRPIEQITGSGYHPCGTAPMGTDRDPLAVTDGRGRVRGVRGVFVGDASLMPTITSSNTNIPSLMIGERLGEWLKALDA